MRSTCRSDCGLILQLSVKICFQGADVQIFAPSHTYKWCNAPAGLTAEVYCNYCQNFACKVWMCEITDLRTHAKGVMNAFLLQLCVIKILLSSCECAKCCTCAHVQICKLHWVAKNFTVWHTHTRTSALHINFWWSHSYSHPHSNFLKLKVMRIFSIAQNFLF